MEPPVRANLKLPPVMGGMKIMFGKESLIYFLRPKKSPIAFFPLG